MAFDDVSIGKCDILISSKGLVHRSFHQGTPLPRSSRLGGVELSALDEIGPVSHVVNELGAVHLSHGVEGSDDAGVGGDDVVALDEQVGGEDSSARAEWMVRQHRGMAGVGGGVRAALVAHQGGLHWVDVPV